jgi:sulfonate transport system permease protein
MSSIEEAPRGLITAKERFRVVSTAVPRENRGAPGLMLLSWAAPFPLIVVWEALARFGGLSPHILPAPSKIALTGAKLIARGDLLDDMAISLARASAATSNIGHQ